MSFIKSCSIKVTPTATIVQKSGYIMIDMSGSHLRCLCCGYVGSLTLGGLVNPNADVAAGSDWN